MAGNVEGVAGAWPFHRITFHRSTAAADMRAQLGHVRAHVGRQSLRFDKEIIHANPEDRGRALDQLVARRVFEVPLDPGPIGR